MTLVIPDPNSASLSIPTVVEAVVREFVITSIRIHERWVSREITPAESTAQAWALTGRMQAIFFGRLGDYEAARAGPPSPQHAGIAIIA